MSLISQPLTAAIFFILAAASSGWAASPPGIFEIQREVIARGNEQADWRQVRTAPLPGKPDSAITILSQTTPKGSHGYRDVFFQRTDDAGQNWTTPEAIPSLRRSRQPDGADHAFSDLWPLAHPPTRTVLITGKIFTFENGTTESTRPMRYTNVANATFGPFGCSNCP